LSTTTRARDKNWVRATRSPRRGTLLGRLEDKLHRARECRSDLAEHFSNPQPYSRMNIVTTRMLDSVVLGPVRHCIHFLDWQGIHVGAHGHGRTGTVSFKKPDNASVGDTSLDRKTETLQTLRN